ncbi:MAG: hypothetical protein ACOC3Z_00495 [Nanoarchaeota archaeon]
MKLKSIKKLLIIARNQIRSVVNASKANIDRAISDPNFCKNAIKRNRKVLRFLKDVYFSAVKNMPSKYRHKISKIMNKLIGSAKNMEQVYKEVSRSYKQFQNILKQFHPETIMK